jgi:hypothetical protein
MLADDHDAFLVLTTDQAPQPTCESAKKTNERFTDSVV